MTLAQYMATLRRRLGDTGAYFTTNELSDYGQEAQRDIAQRLKPWLLPEFTAVATGSVAAGSKFTLPTNLAQIDSLSLYNTTNKDIECRLVINARAFKQLSDVNVFYAASERQPFAYVEVGQFYILPDHAGMKYKLRYVSSPGSVTSGQEMGLQSRWEDLALDYGQYLALMHEKRSNEAQVAYQKYLEKVKAVNEAA